MLVPMMPNEPGSPAADPDLAKVREWRQQERELETNLVARIRARDSSAMAELYDCYGSLIFSVIFRTVGSRTIAEDLTQEAFMRVWTSIAGFDARRAALRTWLVAIARNKAIDYLRSPNAQFARISCNLEDFVETRVAVDETMENKLSSQASIRRLEGALEHLTAQQQQVIRLTYFEGKTQTEIAEILRAPLGSVKTWVRSGLKRLRELVAQQNGFGGRKCETLA